MERKKSDPDRENQSDRDRQRDTEQESSSSTAEAEPVASLHQVVGNQAVQRLHDGGVLQANLAVSQPDDPAEREAERVAEQVMTARSPTFAETAAATGEEPPGGDRGGSTTPGVNPIADGAPRIDESPRSGGAGSGQQAGEDVERALESSSGGKSLPPAARSYFEQRFGRDFGDVRVHTDGEAADLNRQLDAKASTHGSDVYFAEGQYRPGSSDGKQLLAHELTHVVQQTGENATAATSRISRKPTSGKEGEGKAAPGASGSAMGLPFLLGGVGSQLGSMGAPGGETGRRYNLNLKVEYPFRFERKRNNVSWKVVHGDLQYLHSLIEGYKKAYKEQHESLKQQAENQPLVSAVANVFGDVEMPGMHIWSGIPVSLDLVNKQLQTFKDRPDLRPQLKGSIIHNLDVALDDLIAARKKVKKYKEGTIEGAEDAKTTLEVTVTISKTSVSIGAGVLTGGMGTFAGSAASAGVGTTLEVGTEFARESSEISYDLREEYDIEHILVEKGLGTFVSGFVGGVIAGGLGTAFKRISSRYLRRIGYVDKINRRLDDEGLERINQSDLISWLEREGVKFVKNYSKEVLSSSVKDAIKRYRDSDKPLTPETILEDAVKNFWDKEVVTKAVVNHGLSSTSRVSNSPQG